MVVKVAVNGFGTIGKRVAWAVSRQDDMRLLGIVKRKPDFEALEAFSKGYPIYVSEPSLVSSFEERGMSVQGTLEELLEKADIVVDATPAGVGREYAELYKNVGIKAVFQGGEEHGVAEISFNTFCNFEEAHGKSLVRVVSCNTTGLLRLACWLSRYFSIDKVRAFIVRRGADPKEHGKGPINSIVVKPSSTPSHHGFDAMTVVKGIDFKTYSAVVPTTLMHVHFVTLRLRETVRKEDVVRALEEAPRVLLVDGVLTGIHSTSQVMEFFRGLGRPWGDVPELIVWSNSISGEANEATLIQAVHQESIVIPENIDAIRAMTGSKTRWRESVDLTDKSLGLISRLSFT